MVVKDGTFLDLIQGNDICCFAVSEVEEINNGV